MKVEGLGHMQVLKFLLSPSLHDSRSWLDGSVKYCCNCIMYNFRLRHKLAIHSSVWLSRS